MRQDEIRALFADSPESLSVPQVAAKLGRTDETVTDWIDKQGLPAFKAGRRWVIRRDGLITWLIDQNRDDNPHQ